MHAIKNAVPAAPNATIKSPRLQYASTIATTQPPIADALDCVLEKTAGNVIAANTVYGM